MLRKMIGPIILITSLAGGCAVYDVAREFGPEREYADYHFWYKANEWERRSFPATIRTRPEKEVAEHCPGYRTQAWHDDVMVGRKLVDETTGQEWIAWCIPDDIDDWIR